ncbi:hypothetical protein C8Q73DRAFT_320120 [Cubamyces lactineus]|nr:hypothetical protein C8Q73DRAFT_320120 [Cubamyces lactineus]
MGQFYTLYNIDLGVYHYGGLYLSQWIFQSSHEDIVQLLRWGSPIVLPGIIDEYMQEGKPVVQRSTLLELPNELLDIIFGMLIGDMGFLSLAVTCKDLLTFSKRHLPEFYRWFQPQWGGCRIICFGEDTTTLDELPPRLLLPREREELRADIEKGRSVYSTLSYRYDKQDALQSYIRRKWLKRIDDDIRNGLYGNTRYARYHGRMTDWMLFSTILSHRPYGSYPKPLPGGPEVLCNLEKRERSGRRVTIWG